MLKSGALRTALAVCLLALMSPTLLAQGERTSRDEIERLVAAMLGDTPLIEDLEVLTDEIGGRPTASAANLRAVEWALERFRAADVAARKEPFEMSHLWLARGAGARISGEGVSFSPRVAAMPWSVGTVPDGVTRPLRDAGSGTPANFERLGERAQDAFLLVETPLLTDIAGLFREYSEAAAIERRAFDAGATGLVYMGSRPNNALYRQIVSVGAKNTRPMLVMERDGALRALRLLRKGTALTLTVALKIDSGPAYESYNVVGEIRGAARPEEVVLMGAHLDSWDLGTGALDNGANVAMMIDIARQMRRLGLRPARTVRFALWNGEELGMVGSRRYTESHAAELDNHIVAGSVDIGCGRITGFFTNGRTELIPALDRVLEPVRGLGPFRHTDAPVVGTDNFDFMLQGVPNLVANHEPDVYGPNYHARTDQFHRCAARQLRENAAIIAAVVYGLAQGDDRWPRQTRAQIEELVRTTEVGEEMRTFGLWEDWASGRPGRALTQWTEPPYLRLPFSGDLGAFWESLGADLGLRKRPGVVAPVTCA